MRYEFVEGSSSKFWDVELQGQTLNLKWGRIGTEGQSQQKKFPTPEKARAEHDKLVAEKVKKGYRAVGAPAGVKAKAVKVAQKVSTATHFLLHVSHHQFSLEDSDHTDQSFTFDALDDGLEAQRHGVVAHLRRAAGRIPIVVEVRGEPPPADFDAFHLVTEGSFEAPSGQLEVASPEANWPGSIAVPAGWLRVQLRQADLDTSTYDGSDGADHYRVIIWPAPAAKTKVLLSRDVKNGAPFKAKVKLAQLEHDLASRNPTVRCLAVNEAVRHLRAGEKKALAVLRSATQDESDAVRAVTLSALGVTGTSQRAAVLELISTKAADRDEEVRERVPEALSRLGGKDGAAGLVALLSNKDGELAKKSARLLWTVTEFLEADDLVPTLKSKKAETRLAALDAVKTLGEGRGWDQVTSVGALVRALAKDKDRAVKELATSLIEKLGAPIGELIELAKGSTEQRESAATALGKSRSPEAYEPLLRLLKKDEDTGVRRTAAEALGLLGDRRAIPELAKYLEDGTFNLHWWCARGLAKLGGADATKWLWKYVVIPDADERYEYLGREASSALAGMYRARAKVKAGEELSLEYDASPDVDDSVVKLAVLTGSKDDRLVERGLMLLEFGEDVEAVASALSSQRAETASQALLTLREMISRPNSDALKKRALKAAVPHAAAMAKRPDLRCRWLELLASLGGTFARETALVAAKDPNADVRRAAAQALGSLGPDGALDVLGPLLDDKSDGVRHAAAGALGSCQKDKAAAIKVLSAFIKGARGSPKAAAEYSLRELRE